MTQAMLFSVTVQHLRSDQLYQSQLRFQKKLLLRQETV